MATNTGDLYVNIKADIKDLKKGLNQATKEIKKFGGNMKKSTKQNENFFKSFAKGRNDLVRTIRQLETLFVATLAIRASYKVLIGQGLELNKQYQDQALGIAALISAKTTMIDANGKELSSYEQFIATQEVTKGVMDDIKEAALETPASFQQMVGFYQQSIGHALTANGTFGESMKDVNKNVIKMTQGMSALGSSMGMEMMKINEEIRSIMSGNASTDSMLSVVLFGSPSEANEAIRNAKKSTNGLSNLLLDALAPFKNVQDVTTYSKAIARLGASFEEMQKGITADLFDDLTYAFVDLKAEMDEGMGDFIQSWVEVYNEAKAFFDLTFGALGDIGGSVSDLIGDIFDMTGELKLFKIVAIAIVTIFKAIEKAVLGVRMALNEAKTVAYKVQEATGTGKASVGNVRSQQQIDKLNILYSKYMTDRTDARKNAYDNLVKQINKENQGKLDIQLKANEDYYDTLMKQRKQMEEEMAENILDFSASGDEYDAVAGANDMIRDMEESYKGFENIDDAYKSIAASTEAAVDAANGNVSILKRISAESRKVVKSAQAELLARTSTRKMLGGAAKEAKKASKVASKAAADAAKIQNELDKARDKAIKKEQDALKTYNDLVADIGDDLASSLAGLFGPVGDELYSFYKDTMDLMATFDAAEEARVAANTARAAAQAAGEAPAAITKAASQAGLYGAIAMAALLAAMGISKAINSSVAVSPLENFDSDYIASDSSANALDRLYDVQYPMLGLTRDMKNYLSIIASAFGNIENSIIKSGVDLTGDSYLGSENAGIFSSKTYSLEGTTLDFDAVTFDEAIGGQIQAEMDLVIKKVYDSWFKTKTSFFHNYEDVSNLFADDLAEATRSAAETFYLMGEALGIGLADLGDMSIDIGQFKTTGMSPDEIAQEIESRFNAEMDAVADALFADLAEYQLGGEGMYETVIRVATNMDQVTHSLSLMGVELTEATKNVTIFAGTWAEYTFSFTKNIFDLTEAMIKGAGDIDALESGISIYMENFFTEQEQLAMSTQNMETIFGTLGYTMPQTTEEFRSLVDSLDLTTIAGAEAYGELMTVTEGFSEWVDIMEELNSTITTLNDPDLYSNLMSTITGLTSREIALTGDDTAIAEYGITAAEIMLDAIEAQTELHDITMDNYFDQLEAAHLAGDLTSDQLENWTSIGDALMTVEEATKSYTDLLMQQAEVELAFHEGTLDKIIDLYTESSSYLNSIEKADYLGAVSSNLLDIGDTQGYLDTLAEQLAFEKATATTKEDYIPIFENYISQLQNAEPEEDPVVKTLEDILEQNARIEEAIANSSYQASLTPLQVTIV